MRPAPAVAATARRAQHVQGAVAARASQGAGTTGVGGDAAHGPSLGITTATTTTRSTTPLSCLFLPFSQPHLGGRPPSTASSILTVTPAPPHLCVRVRACVRHVQVVQCLTELGLSIRRSRISSDGGWFVDGEPPRPGGSQGSYDILSSSPGSNLPGPEHRMQRKQ